MYRTTETQKPYSAKAVANSILELARNHGENLTPMKLQKLLYFAHGWHLAFTGKPLLNEQVEAWQWGPVVPSIYHSLKQFGLGLVKGLCTDQLGEAPVIAAEDTDTHYLLSEVWRVYGGLTAMQLSNLSHQEGGPWHQANEKNAFRLKGWPIPMDAIQDHYKSLRERNNG